MYTASPCFAVPLPAGKPTPLGGILMSHAATSCAVATRPRLGPVVGTGDPLSVVAQAADRTANASPAIARSEINIGDAPVSCDFPGLDRMVVIALLRRQFRKQRRARRLHVSFLVDGTALEQRALAVPLPRHAESRHALGEDRPL